MDGRSPQLKAVNLQLGSSCYRMGALENGTPITLLNKFGKDETSAYFALDGPDTLYGDDAVAHASIQPHNTTNSIMKQFHRTLTGVPVLQNMTAEDILRKILEGLIFDAIPGWDGNPTIKAVVVTSAHSYLQVNRTIIEKIVKETLEKQCPNVLIASVLKSTAAFVAYAMRSEKVSNGRYLVLVMGAFITEMVMVELSDNVARTLGQPVSFAFGGGVFDHLLVKHCCDEFQKETGIDANQDSGALELLLNKCEVVKRKLSAAKVAVLDIPQFCQGKKIKVQITRDTLEALGAVAVGEFASFLRTALADYDLPAFSGFIVVGGASRMPCIQRAIAEIFPRNLIKTSMNPEAHVAVLNGAAFLSSVFASAELADSLSTGVLDISLMKSCAKNNVLQHLSNESRLPGDFLLSGPQTSLEVISSQEDTHENAVAGIQESGTDFVREDDSEEGQPISTSQRLKTDSQPELEDLVTDDEDDVNLDEKGSSTDFQPVTPPFVPIITSPRFIDDFTTQRTEITTPNISGDLTALPDRSTQTSSMPVFVEQPKGYGSITQITAATPVDEEPQNLKKAKSNSKSSINAKKLRR